jgi:hypothetical protein
MRCFHVIPAILVLVTAGVPVCRQNESRNSGTELQDIVNRGCRGRDQTIRLTAGVFVVNRSVLLPSNCALEGRGQGVSTIRLAASTNEGYVLTNADPIAGNQAIRISNLTIDGNNLHQSPTGNARTGCISMTNVTSIEVINVQCLNPYHNGIQGLDVRTATVRNSIVRNTIRGNCIVFGNSEPPGPAARYAVDINIAENEVNTCRTANGIFVVGSRSPNGYESRQIRIAQNRVWDAGDVGIEVGTSTSDVRVEQNDVSVSGNGRTGILVRSARDVQLLKNHISSKDHSTTQIGIYIWNDTFDNTAFRNIGVEANVISGFAGPNSSGLAWSSVSPQSRDINIGCNVFLSNRLNLDPKTKVQGVEFAECK